MKPKVRYDRCALVRFVYKGVTSEGGVPMEHIIDGDTIIRDGNINIITKVIEDYYKKSESTDFRHMPVEKIAARVKSDLSIVLATGIGMGWIFFGNSAMIDDERADAFMEHAVMEAKKYGDKDLSLHTHTRISTSTVRPSREVPSGFPREMAFRFYHTSCWKNMPDEELNELADA